MEAVLPEERLAQPPRALLLWVMLGELNGEALGFSSVQGSRCAWGFVIATE